MRPLIPGEVIDPSPPRRGPRPPARITTPRRRWDRHDVAPWLMWLALVTALLCLLALDPRSPARASTPHPEGHSVTSGQCRKWPRLPLRATSVQVMSNTGTNAATPTPYHPWKVDNRWSPGTAASAPDNAPAAYSARWIDKGGTAEILPDRQGFAYNDEAARRTLIDHLQSARLHTRIGSIGYDVVTLATTDAWARRGCCAAVATCTSTPGCSPRQSRPTCRRLVA